MRRIPMTVFLISLINLIAGVVLLYYKIPYGLGCILMFIITPVPRGWARSLGIALCGTVVIAALGWMFTLIAIGETVLIVLMHNLAALGIGTVYFIFAVAFYGEKTRKYYFRTELNIDKEDLGKDGWICPQCKAKNRFSIYCWNCDLPKEKSLENKKVSKKEPEKLTKQADNPEGEKAGDTKADDTKKKPVEDKISSFLKKKKELKEEVK